MRPLDTSPDAARRQLEVWRNKSRTERLRLTLDMSELVRECAKSRIRKRNPEWSERQVTRRLISELYGI